MTEKLSPSEIVEDLRWRYACKKFDAERKLSDEEVEALLESLRLTASSFGLQPWKFFLVNNQELRKELTPACFGQKQVEEASHLIVMCAVKNVDESYVDEFVEEVAKTQEVDVSELEKFKKSLMYAVNRPEEKKLEWAIRQVYIALGNLLTVCASMKIDSCPMEGFKPSQVDKILGLEDKGLKSVLLCPVGFRAKDDKYTLRMKTRFSKEKVVEVLD